MEQLTSLINRIKSKDRKARYKVLDQIMELSRSKKIKQKAELLKILNEKSFSTEWEERYVSMYGISRFMWRNGKFVDLKETYDNVLRLLEDENDRVRLAAFNALEHFRTFFTFFVYRGYNNFRSYSTVTTFAKFFGKSISLPSLSAMW